MKQIFLIALGLLFSTAAFAEISKHHGHSPYAGEQNREIKSLSTSDLEEISRGAGWGLAKAAELNGVPGPVHLLELKTEIALSEKQIVEIQRLFDDMKKKAIAEGQILIESERALETAFREGNLSEAKLKTLLDDIERSRARLRFVHLSTHLKTPKILSEAQIAHYNALRGYESDPCASIPKGHDPARWRQHNGC